MIYALILILINSSCINNVQKMNNIRLKMSHKEKSFWYFLDRLLRNHFLSQVPHSAFIFAFQTPSLDLSSDQIHRISARIPHFSLHQLETVSLVDLSIHLANL